MEGAPWWRSLSSFPPEGLPLTERKQPRWLGLSSDHPAALVSVPCLTCEGEGCAACDGQGILLLRVRPEDATLEPEELRLRYTNETECP